MPLAFEIFDAESGGFTDAPYPLIQEWERLVDTRQSSGLGEKPFVAALNRLIADTPDFLQAHLELANHWHSIGKPQKTLDAARLGLKYANALIPEGFNGFIEWGHLGNRPYLRLMNFAVLALMRLRRHKDAVALIESMLARNPNDNQGVRYLLGSEALRAGDDVRAEVVFREQAPGFSPYYYELALMHMRSENWVECATALRRGFVANPYIIGMLLDNLPPDPLAMWDAFDFSSRDTAVDYLNFYSAMWGATDGAFAFMHWLVNHPKVMAERASVMEHQEALLWEEIPARRTQILQEHARVVAGIDDKLSQEIVRKRSRHGQQIWPWELLLT